jgi:hypothetical protein
MTQGGTGRCTEKYTAALLVHKHSNFDTSFDKSFDVKDKT